MTNAVVEPYVKIRFKTSAVLEPPYRNSTSESRREQSGVVVIRIESAAQMSPY